MPSRKIEDACEELQKKWPKIKADFEKKFKGWNCILVCSHRTPEEQMEEFKKGRTLNAKTGKWEVTESFKKTTNCDGETTISNHNYYPSHAIDIALQTPKRDLFYRWQNDDKTIEEHWAYITTLAAKYSLTHGGTWKTFKDYPHLEVKA